MITEIIRTKPLFPPFGVDEEYIELFHVIADEGKALTDGETVTKDFYFSKTAPMDNWKEVEYDWSDEE